VLDPNTAQFQLWNELTAQGDFIGQYRPVGRVTFQDASIGSTTSGRPGPWRYLLTELNPTQAIELQVKTIDIDRALGSDSDSCKIDLPNVRQGQYQWEGDDEDPFGVGAFSLDRGASPLSETSVFGEPTSWGYTPNPHSGLLTPNILVRTYQGYGSANFDANGDAYAPGDPGYIHPHDDDLLVLTGVWLIDRTTTTGGVNQPTITVEMRDMGKLLIEQPCYPPALPMERFPLIYSPVPTDTVVPGSEAKKGKNVAKFDTAAMSMHGEYGASASVSGHRGSDAFDGKSSTYWLSHTYESPRSSYSYEWIQAKCGGDKINEIYVHTRKGGYVCYISIYEGGNWAGSKNIPYSAAGHDHSHSAGIDYVKRVTIPSSGKITVRLSRVYNASKVRFTFTNLKVFEEGPYFDYKVAVYEIRAYHTTEAIQSRIIPATVEPGDISDWSQAIKELLGWAGFTWTHALTADPLLGVSALGNLNIWGDFEVLGAGPIESTPGDYFLNKSFAECIRQIADFLGAIFFIDHTGGAQFRMPNVFGAGNFIDDPLSSRLDVRTLAHPIELHEMVNLIGYSVVVDDVSLRSEVLVVGKEPDINAPNQLIAGGANLVSGGIIDFKAMLKGQLRPMAMPADATKLLVSDAECQRMAELVAVRLLFTLRKGSASMYGHPGLHLDDQVRIFERVTNEVNIHYVSGINSRMDLESGEYTMDLTTHWLGRDPDSDWFMDRIALTPMIEQLPGLYQRLSESGAVSGGDVV